jgi:hypothetical protein
MTHPLFFPREGMCVFFFDTVFCLAQVCKFFVVGRTWRGFACRCFRSLRKRRLDRAGKETRTNEKKMGGGVQESRHILKCYGTGRRIERQAAQFRDHARPRRFVTCFDAHRQFAAVGDGRSATADRRSVSVCFPFICRHGTAASCAPSAFCRRRSRPRSKGRGNERARCVVSGRFCKGSVRPIPNWQRKQDV